MKSDLCKYFGKTTWLTGLLTLIFVGHMAKANDLKYFLGEGVSGINEQNYKSAISQLDLEIQKIPTNPIPRLQKVKIYIQVDKYDEAISICNELMIQSTNPGTYAFRGLAYYGKEDYDKAIADLSECIRAKPMSTVYLIRGSAYEHKQNYAKAIEDYNEAISLQQNDAGEFLLRGRAYSSKGDFDKAMKDFNLAIQIAPKYAKAYNYRGFLWSKMGDYEKAIADCSQSIFLDKNAGAYNNLAWILATAPDEKFRDGQKALLCATRACELSAWKDPYCMGTLAAAYAETGNFQEAIKWEAKCIESGLPDKDLKQAHELLDLYLQKKPYHADQLK